MANSSLAAAFASWHVNVLELVSQLHANEVAQKAAACAAEAAAAQEMVWQARRTHVVASILKRMIYKSAAAALVSWKSFTDRKCTLCSIECRLKMGRERLMLGSVLNEWQVQSLTKSKDVTQSPKTALC